MDVVSVYSTLFYILLIVLVIILIVLVIEMLKTVSKVNLLLDDFKRKSEKIDGVFDIVESTSGILNGTAEKITNLLTNFIANLFTKKSDKTDIEK